jgi:superfamily I DNA/RNA helicase
MLNDYQRRVAYQLESNTLVSASPGSGKTKTLVARAEHKLDSLPAKKTLALITYTNAAADEIASRLVSNTPIFIGTIHRFCLEYILRPFSWLYNWSKPRIASYENLRQFIDDNVDLSLTIDDLNMIRKDIHGNIDLTVDWNNNNAIEEVAFKYYSYLERINVIDFNEILYRSFKIVAENKFVAISLSNKFYEILIDEFQDTSYFQYSILKIINDSGPTTYFMVGDERQSIYRFAGAFSGSFQNAQTDFSTNIENLPITYRSTNNIVKAYCSLFENHPEIINESENNCISIPIQSIEYDRNNHAGILRQIISHLYVNNGIPLSEIAILSARWQESFFASRELRVNYNVVGLGALPHPSRNLNNSTFNLFRTLVQFRYRQSIGRLRAIKRAIELHFLENGVSYEEKAINVIQNKLLESIIGVDTLIPLENGLLVVLDIFNNTFQVDHPTFHDIILRIQPDELPLWSLAKYFKTLSGVDGITINTIHQAKGLEFEAVVLDSINTGRIPYQVWDSRNRQYLPPTPISIEDGRKLFYVAVSRAKKHLVITHNWNPSFFVDIIRSEV